MLNHYLQRLRLASILLIVPFLALGPAGCSKDETAKPAQVKVTKTSSSASAKQPAAEEIEPEKQTAKAEFIAPYPEKTDIFAAAKPPKPQPKPEVKPVVQEKPPAVRLVGFVSVGEPRAILSIDNQTSVLKPGEIRQNVRLVAIDERTAMLEFKSQRWNLNLLSKTSAGQTNNQSANPTGSFSSAAPKSSSVPSLPALPSFDTLN